MQSINLWRASLLVHPILEGTLIGQDFFGLEPQGNFLLGTFDGVTSVADIASDILTVSFKDLTCEGGKECAGREVTIA